MGIVWLEFAAICRYNVCKQKKGLKANCLQSLDIYGAGERTRTADLLITNQLLYQLSYAGQS